MHVILTHKQFTTFGGIHEIKNNNMQFLDYMTAEISATST